MKRGTIGEMQLASLTPALARDLWLTDTKGALVWNMYRTASAYRAGLRPGDVIVAVDGKAVETPREFQRALAELPIGRVMTLGILREGAKREIKVQVEQHRRGRGRWRNSARRAIVRRVRSRDRGRSCRPARVS